MQSVLQIDETSLSRIAAVAPLIGGALVQPSDAGGDGRLHRVVLAYSEKVKEGMICKDPNDLKNFGDVVANDARRVLVTGVGEFSAGAKFEQAKAECAGNTAPVGQISGELVGADFSGCRALLPTVRNGRI